MAIPQKRLPAIRVTTPMGTGDPRAGESGHLDQFVTDGRFEKLLYGFDFPVARFRYDGASRHFPWMLPSERLPFAAN